MAFQTFAFQAADLVRFDDTFAGRGSLSSMAYGNGLFVAVGNQGGLGPTISSSPDGIDWTIRLVEPSAGVFSGITFGDGSFVAIGSTNAWTSPDGLTWTQRNMGLRDQLSVVGYGNGIYLIAGAKGEIATSTDAFHWIRSTNRTEAGVHSVAYGNGRFVALASTNVLSSTDGTNWVRTAAMGDSYSYLTEIEYGNGLFVGVGLFGRLLTSSDGVDWTSHELGGDDQFRSVNYRDGEFVAIGYANGNALIVAVSFDGLTWGRKIAIPRLAPAYPLKIASGNGIFLAVGNIDSIRIAAISNNGFDWRMVAPTAPFDGFRAMGYGNGQFVVMDDSGRILTSSDGKGWTVRNSDENISSGVSGIAYGQGKFVAAGLRYYSSGSRVRMGGVILTSTDAEVWTNLRLEARLNGIAYGQEQFVAVGPEGLILSSPDGIAWQRENSGTTNWLSHAFHGDGTFIAVGHEGLVLRSSDGSNWTRENSGTTNDLSGGVFGVKRFVVVGLQGTILTSPDGVQWTNQAFTINDSIPKIAFGNKTFVAALGSGQILISTDTLNWTLKRAFTPGCCGLAIAYGQGKFVLASGRIHYADVTQPLLSFGTGPGSNLELVVAGAVGGIYQIETADDLSFPKWAPFGLITNQEVTTAFPEPNRDQARRFYRARLLRYVAP